MLSTKKVDNIVKNEMSNVVSLNESTAVSKWKRAINLHTMYKSVNWKDSAYESWYNFLKKKFPFDYKKLYSSRGHFAKAERLGYSIVDLFLISQKISYSRAANLMVKLKNKISVADFIKTANGQGTPSVRQYVPDESSITIHLPPASMMKLETLLAAHGMGFGLNNRRYSISDAMIKYLDHVMP